MYEDSPVNGIDTKVHVSALTLLVRVRRGACELFEIGAAAEVAAATAATAGAALVTVRYDA